jgi:16S rRNA (uracil1498-N3)-methyltransferase
MSRFYVPPEEWSREALRLGPSEAHHCTHVLRHRPGDEVIAFNGRGEEAACSIEETGKHSVLLRPILFRESPEPRCRITLAQAVPKGQHFDFILQKATELGASGVVPLLTGRTVVRISPGEAPKKREKWVQTVIEASKQCGQNWLPEVREPVPFPAFLESPPDAELRLIASLAPGARPLRDFLPSLPSAPCSVVVAIGPEGDFSPEETAAALAAGFRPITFGDIVLRVETAALYALSILSYEFLLSPR